ncbi:MAG: hypothetical protein KJI72_01605 [Patescibacteria group bacterium]|nr:hypothetical protein [Patescibacteria group bacterium]
MSTKQKWFLLGFILFLIVTLSFGIGYLVAKEANPAPIIIEKNSGEELGSRR